MLRSTRFLHFTGLSIVGVVGGAAAAQIATAQPRVEVFEVNFGSEVLTLCSDGGPIDHGESEFALGEFGFQTPGEAFASYQQEIREAASNPEIPEELRKLLGPTRNTEFTPVERDADAGVAFFDVVSDGPADLEARVVVVDTGDDGWKVADTYRCMSTIVDDYEEYNQLATEVYGR